MKIGFYTNTYLPNIFGSTNSIEYFRKGLEELGHEVYVFAPERGGYLDSNPHVIRYPAIQWHYKIDYPLAISYYPPFANLAKKLDLDLVHIHQPFLMGREGIRQAKRNGLPVVFTYHCRYEEYTHYAPIFPDWILKSYVKSRAISVANKCDLVVAPTDEIRDMLTESGVKKNINVLSTGIDWDKYQQGNRKRTRNALGIKDGSVCLLWVGRIEKEKNVAMIKRVISDVLRKNKKAVFMVIGDGSEKQGMIDFFRDSRLRSRVIFTGLIPQAEIEDYYSAADVLVNFSLSETQGLVLNEAMASGLLVTSVKSTGANDLIRNGETGILVDVNDMEYRELLEKVINNFSTFDHIRMAAKEDAKRYDYKTKAKQLESFYFKLIKNRQNK